MEEYNRIGDWGKMKVGLLTVHQSVNCGASLQAGALYRSIEELGHDVSIINYRPYYFVSDVDEARSGGPRSIKSEMKKVLIGSRLRRTKECFDKYQQACFPKLTKPFTNPDQLYAEVFDYDVAVCGSDQIWNPSHIHFDKTWFFDFLTDTKLVSYAASIGKDILTVEEKKWLKRELQRFSAVGVREDTAVQLLNDLGVDSKICIDPTLLRSESEWRSLESAPEIKLPERFIFYYPLQKNPDLETELLLELKKLTNLPCVALSDSLVPPKGADMRVTGFGPGEFLYLLDNSEYVFTNSFHGLVFSLLFKKRLVSFANTTKNSRLESLCRLAGLGNYQVESVEQLRTIDWDYQQELICRACSNLSALRDSSFEFLKCKIQ